MNASFDQDLFQKASSFYEEGNFSDALSLFQQLVLQNPSSPYCWNGVAACLQQQKRYEIALIAWRKALETLTDEPSLYLQAAICAFHAKEEKEGFDYLDAAEKYNLDPKLKENIAQMKQAAKKEFSYGH